MEKPNEAKQKSRGAKALELFLTFMKIGAFTFGGGYAMLSIIENSCVEKKGWITHDDLMNITVIAESTPGPVAVNCATFVGYKQAGLPGAAAATLGVVLPSFIIIYLISLFLNDLLKIAVIANAFRGIKLAVALLIISAGVNMFKKLRHKDALSLIILFSSLAAMLAINLFSLKFSSIALMLIAACVSLCVFSIRLIGQRGGHEK